LQLEKKFSTKKLFCHKKGFCRWIKKCMCGSECYCIWCTDQRGYWFESRSWQTYFSSLFEIWKLFKYNTIIKKTLDIILKNLTAYSASARTWSGDLLHQGQTPSGVSSGISHNVSRGCLVQIPWFSLNWVLVVSRKKTWGSIKKQK